MEAIYSSETSAIPTAKVRQSQKSAFSIST
jgi:hypothetical protein